MKNYWNIPEDEQKKLVDKAANFIGTGRMYRSWACIDSALRHAKWIEKELNGLRKKISRSWGTQCK
jgi:hypothetical protein